MKRSALSTALLYAAGGFAITAGIHLAPTLQADGEQKAFAVVTSVSTKTFDAAIRYNPKTSGQMLEIVNSTDQPLTTKWTLRISSAGEVSPLSRVPAIQKDSYTKATISRLAAKQTVTIPLDIPEAKPKEFRSVYVDIGGTSLAVDHAVKVELSSTSSIK